MFKSVLFDKVIKPKIYCIGIDWLAWCFINAYKKAVGFSPGRSKLFTEAVIILLVFLQNIKDDLRDLYCSFAACIFSRNGNNTFAPLILRGSYNIDYSPFAVNVFPFQAAKLPAPNTRIQGNQNSGSYAYILFVKEQVDKPPRLFIVKIFRLFALHLWRLHMLRGNIKGDKPFALCA